MATRTQQIRRFQRSHSRLKMSQQETPSNIYKWFICQKLELLTYVFAADRMGLHSTFISFHVIMLQRRTVCENRVLREIATKGRSRSFIVQSVTGQQGVAYRHIILLALSVKFPKKYHSNRQKLPSSTTLLSFEAPCEYPHIPYISTHYIH